MSLKERLLLLITPLVIFPVAIGSLLILTISHDGTPLIPPNFKIAFLFIVLALLISTFVILSRAANLLTGPIKSIVKDIERISHGDFGHAIAAQPQSFEMKDLIYAIDQMKHELKRRDEMIKEEAAMGAVGKIASQIAHDLRSPLATIAGFTKSANELTEEDFREYQAATLRSIDRINTMTDEMLNYMKARRIERSKVEIEPFLKSISDDVSSALLKGTMIELKVSSQENFVIETDEQKLNRVLTNLLVNSAQAMSCGNDGVIFMNSWREGKDFCLQVSDTGKGIDKSDIEKIFEPGYTKGKKNGTGLGLAYVKNVIDAHNGTINVESELGKGTTFTIRLPEAAMASSYA